jgi:hypothetical protein
MYNAGVVVVNSELVGLVQGPAAFDVSVANTFQQQIACVRFLSKTVVPNN